MNKTIIIRLEESIHTDAQLKEAVEVMVTVEDMGKYSVAIIANKSLIEAVNHYRRIMELFHDEADISEIMSEIAKGMG